MRHKYRLALVVLLFGGVILGQSATTPSRSSTAHVQGGIRDEDGRALSNVKVRFQRGSVWNTLTTNGAGEFEADLPPGLYTMDVMVRGFEPYHRPLFTVNSHSNLTFEIALPPASRCHIGITGSSPQALTEEQDAASEMLRCEAWLAVPRAKGVAFPLFVQYGSLTYFPYVYYYAAKSDLDPVFVAYNLFSLEADEVSYDIPSQTLDAHGHVVIVDEPDGESGSEYKVRTGDWMKFKILNGQANLTGCDCNQVPRKYTRGRLFHQDP